jgi:hypothetical protein
MGSGGEFQSLAHVDARASTSFRAAVTWCMEKRLFVAGPLSGAKNNGSEQPRPEEPETTNRQGSGRVATLAFSSCESSEKRTCCIGNVLPVTSKGRGDFRARAHFPSPILLQHWSTFRLSTRTLQGAAAEPLSS